PRTTPIPNSFPTRRSSDLVDTHTGHLTVGKQITLKSTTTPPGGFPSGGFTATNGAEQPAWDRSTGKFYVSIPEVNGNGGTSPSGDRKSTRLNSSHDQISYA